MASQLIRLLGNQYKAALDELLDEVNVDAPLDDQEGVIKARTDIGPTTKEQIIKARRGQGMFRANVRRVTKVANPALLIASHIKPWIDSSDEEKSEAATGFSSRRTWIIYLIRV